MAKSDLLERGVCLGFYISRWRGGMLVDVGGAVHGTEAANGLST